MMISIPPWYDWKPDSVNAMVIHIDISIPPWYDWKRQINGPALGIMQNFNSTMVRLEEGRKARPGKRILPFQFHHGTIGSNRNKLLSKLKEAFQFHHGTIGSDQYDKHDHIGVIFQFHHGTIGSKKTVP